MGGDPGRAPGRKGGSSGESSSMSVKERWLLPGSSSQRAGAFAWASSPPQPAMASGMDALPVDVGKIAETVVASVSANIADSICGTFANTSATSFCALRLPSRVTAAPAWSSSGERRTHSG